MKLLISIICIDRDIFNIPYLSEVTKNYDLLIICRITDIISDMFKLFRKVNVIKVPNYIIKGRHNMEMICHKRNTALMYAKVNKYDKLLFIDSDLRPKEQDISDVLILSEKYPIISLLYPIKWTESRFAVAYKDSLFMDSRQLPIEGVYKNINICKIDGSGVGFCLISVFDIPFEVKNVGGIIGEDIGFFWNLRNKGVMVVSIPGRIIEHR